MGEVTDMVDWMVNEEAAQGRMVEGQCGPSEDVDTITGLAGMYLWWTLKSMEVEKKNATQMVGFLHEESEGPNHLGSVTFWKS